MPKGKPWSTEQEMRLRSLVEAKTHIKAIAAQFGLSQDG